jgi:hypothetical protein
MIARVVAMMCLLAVVLAPVTPVRSASSPGTMTDLILDGISDGDRLLVTLQSQGVDLTPTEADAVRIRADLGLASDLRTVRRTAAGEDNSSDLMGIPLTPDEEKEVLRRSGIAESVSLVMPDLWADPAFAGAYIDEAAGGTPVFLFAADESEQVKQLSDDVGVEVQILRVERSQDDLLALQERVTDDQGFLAKEGIEVVSTGILSNRNAVLVGIHDVDEATVNEPSG